MARPPRIDLPDTFYYITSRTSAGRNVFRKPEDPKRWLTILSDICSRYKWIVHAYCLMPDHYHLVIKTTEPTLSIGMRQLNGIYTQSYNEQYSLSGQLFRGRFRSVIVQQELYLDDITKYVLESPVRAGFTKYPFQYKWSNCKYLKDPGNVPEWFNTQWYSDELVSELLDTKEYSPRDEQDCVLNHVRKQIFLCDDVFEQRLLSIVSDTKDKIPESTGINSEDMESFISRSRDRNEAVYRAYYYGRYSMKEIGDYFSIHYSTVSRIIKSFEQNRIN